MTYGKPIIPATRTPTTGEFTELLRQHKTDMRIRKGHRNFSGIPCRFLCIRPRCILNDGIQQHEDCCASFRRHTEKGPPLRLQSCPFITAPRTAFVTFAEITKILLSASLKGYRVLYTTLPYLVTELKASNSQQNSELIKNGSKSMT